MRKLGVFGITLLGLWTLIWSVQAFFVSLNFATSSSGDLVTDMSIGFSILPALTLVVIGGALVTLRYRLASRLFNEEESDTSIESVALTRLGLILIGVATIISGLQSIAYVVFEPVVMQFGNYYETEPFVAYLPSILAQSSGVLMGVALVWFSDTIASFVWRRERVVESPDTTVLPHCPSCGAPYDPQDYDPTAKARCTECGETLRIDGA